MRIFLSGATGHVGASVLDALQRRGHDVTTLVRTPQKAEQVSHRAVTVVVGDLATPASYEHAAGECDAIVHTALEASASAQSVDRIATETFLSVTGRRADAGLPACLVYTSGVWVLGHTAAPADEDARLDPPALFAWRPEHEQMVLGAARGAALRTVVLRPGIVYGGARGVIGDMLRDALNGLVRVVGAGTNHWACVYDRDLADLYARLVSHPDAAGIVHANDEADESVNEIVDAVARHATSRPDVRHMPLPEAQAKMGLYADALALDQIVRSPRARALGWAPSLHSVSGNVARLLEEFRPPREAA